MAPALGDGCADDTSAIQVRLDALVRIGASPTGSCPPTGGSKWGPFYSGLYFPAGRYRITQPLVIPNTHGWRLFGAGGDGGRISAAGVPVSALIEQDTPDTPIFIIGRWTGNPDPQPQQVYVWGWTIERLGFSWKDQQDAPSGWAFREPGEAPPPNYTDPGAVAILIAGPLNGKKGGTYHGLIRGCVFEKGWRGIAIDDTHPAPLGIWNTHIEHCRFSSFRGAAISLVNQSGQDVGMPNNSIVSTFVENYTKEDAFLHRNEEEQIRVTAQSGMRMESLDLEGSKFRLFRFVDCTLTMTATHIEHVEIRNEQYPRMFYFGGGRYIIQGMTVDGP